MSLKLGPLYKLGFPSHSDYKTLKKYLRLPKPYLVHIVLNYRPSLQQVPMEIVNVVRGTHEKLNRWLDGKIKNMDDDKEKLRTQLYRSVGIPPMFCTPLALPTCAAPILSAYSLLCEKIKGAASGGKVLYLHSNMGTMSLLAASGIMQAAVDAKLKVRMIAFPELMERIKDFDNTFETTAVVTNHDLLCLYLIGTEYVAQSGFTESQLEQLVARRRVLGKSTLLCSHLEPKEFEERYKRKLAVLSAIPLKFDDDTVTATVASLVKELRLI